MTGPAGLPGDAWPVAVYAADRRTTPDRMRTEENDDALILWIDGLMLGTPRQADDTKLSAALVLSAAIVRAAEQHMTNIRGELARRRSAREVDVITAVERARTEQESADAR